MVARPLCMWFVVGWLWLRRLVCPIFVEWKNGKTTVGAYHFENVTKSGRNGGWRKESEKKWGTKFLSDSGRGACVSGSGTCTAIRKTRHIKIFSSQEIVLFRIFFKSFFQTAGSADEVGITTSKKPSWLGLFWQVFSFDLCSRAPARVLLYP